MAINWKGILESNVTAWSIPAGTLTERTASSSQPTLTLIAARNETTRTSVATAQCRTAFEDLRFSPSGRKT
jgi:hypothetical protein